MREALYEGVIFDLQTYLEERIDKKVEIVKLKKRAQKGAFTCPYCDEILILKSGEVREEHFAHRHSRACEISTASEVYQKQTKRETRKHSFMKEIIYDELKSQEKLTANLQVDYGYVSKATEKWKYYPDIVMHNKGKEIAITILTDVSANEDEKLAKQIQKRNRYFQEKEMMPIWFVENAEQSVDMVHRVIHLWEAELDLAIQTTEDTTWAKMLNELSLKVPLFELFAYHYKDLPAIYDVRSLYFVRSTEEHIAFTVQRFILDEVVHPYRAFALNDAYEISLSTALQARDTLQLSDPQIEKQQRADFLALIKQREEQLIVKEQEIKQVPKEVAATIEVEKKVTMPKLDPSKYKEEMIAYATRNQEFSATEISEYLVRERGASAETFTTGRYKVYPTVCEHLESLVAEEFLLFVKKDFVNDRVYRKRSQS